MRPRLLPALVLSIILILTAAVAPGKGPNIVVFLVDDLGWNDSTVDFGLPKDPKLNSHYRTPGLERLTKEGTRFSQAYATPVCTPSRVSLLTGLSAARHGVTNWTLAPGKEIGAKVGGMDMPDWNCDGLQPPGSGAKRGFETDLTLPFLLRKAGYRTIMVGKAHFGARDTPGADPTRLGFDVNIGGSAAAQPGSYSGLSNFSDRRPGKEFWDVPDLAEFHGKDITVTQALTDKAIAEMARARADGKPFYLHLAHYGVHTPIEAAKAFAGDYRDLDLPQKEKDYATMVADVDRSLARVLEALDRLGLAKDTVVVFLSDNGGFAQRAGAYAPRNAPLTSGKGSAYDGGLRTPMVVRWPGVAQADALTREVASIEDLMPTFLVAAGQQAPKGVDGRDLAPVLRGGSRPPRDLLWHYPHVWGVKGPGVEPFAAIRRGDLKLIHFLIDGRSELYDVADDPGETKDLAASRAEEAGKLRDDLLAALRAAGRELPRRR
jgi:arylsulfatase A-like enzyme